MKIVHVVDGFFPDSLGGTEKYIYSVAQRMQNKEHHVTVVSSKVGCSEQYDFEGVSVYRFAISAYPDKKEYIGLKAPSGLDEFMQIIENIEPDIVHFHTFNRAINYHHLLAVGKQGIKTAFTSHLSGVFCANGTLINDRGQACDGILTAHNCVSCTLNKRQRSLRNVLVSFAAKILIGLPGTEKLNLPPSFYYKKSRQTELSVLSEFCDCNVALSEWIEKMYHENGVKNVRLVKQGISSLFKPATTGNAAASYPITILFVGRIYPAKGLDYFCEALNQIDKTKIKVIFACVHYNDEYSMQIKDSITKLPDCEWYENVATADLVGLMARSHLLLLPSRHEMSPLVTLEALACNLPVLGSDIRPITDNIRHMENGLIFKNGDMRELADMITQVIEQPQIIDRLRENIVAPRTFEVVGDDLLKIYDELINQ